MVDALRTTLPGATTKKLRAQLSSWKRISRHRSKSVNDVDPSSVEAVVTLCAEESWLCPTRQTGSHIRLTTERNGQHHITVPQKRQLTIGKINAVIWEMVRHFGVDRKTLVSQVFG